MRTHLLCLATTTIACHPRPVPPPPAGAEAILDGNTASNSTDAIERFGQHPPPTCPEPVVPEPVTAPATPQTWFIHSDGVGDIPKQGRLPEVVMALEGRTYDELVLEPLRAVPEEEHMAQRLVNMEGHRTLALTAVDLTIELDWEGHILTLEPGPTLRTPRGTGASSTLGQLVEAHGAHHMARMPPPWHCVISLEDLPGVGFLFSSCEAACRGDGVTSVVLVSPVSYD